MNADPSFPPPRPISGTVLKAFSLLLMVGILHGALAFGCYFINEFRRLSNFELALLFLGDAIGLFWFLRYVVRWQFGLIDETPRPLGSSKFPLSVWMMLISMGLGLLAELAMTMSLHHDEQAGFHRAVPATCVLHSATAQFAQGVPTYWKIDGEYQDGAGNMYAVTYYLRESDDLQRLPGPAVLAIQQMRLPILLPIVYDPERPGRSWIPQLGWDDANRLHYMSLVILLFQFLGSMLFVVLLGDSIKSHNHLPWWTELHSLIPLGTQAFIMALFGGLELYIVRRFCP